jgi:7-carboxy-7-deazaguanine synthase
MVVRVSEVYASSQGEGPNVGKTTVFLRFGGCNLRCPGWPCDTQHAIQPQFRNDWKKWDVVALADHVLDVAEDAGATDVTLTGGEPFLQPRNELLRLIEILRFEGEMDIEAFSNGTIQYPDWAPEHISFIVDWKLPGSGEDPYNKNRITNLKLLNHAMRVAEETAPFQAVKFVCKDIDDLITAEALWEVNIKGQLSQLEVFYGKVWEGNISDAELVEYVMKHQLPWRLNRQEHNYIWPANERGR